MKSSIPESTTLAQLIAMLREGSFPFDLNGINEEAWEYIGPALNKNNLLRDDTASALGLPEYPESSIHPTVDDAFMRIANRLYAIAQGGRLVRVLLTDYTGTPCPNFTIHGMHGPQGEVCVTDAGGFVEGVVDSDPATLSTDAFTDLDSISIDVSAPSGDITDVSMVFPESAFKNYVSYSTSGTDIFSPICKRIDVTAVGGGGGGAGASLNGAGGGGGGYVTVTEDVEFSANVTYTRTVGSGGSGGNNATTSSNGTDGGKGGTSSALGVSASGGSGGGTNAVTAAAGNGKGGTRKNSAPNGGAGTVEGFSSFTETKLYGGGGGAGSYYWNYSLTGQTITDAAGTGGSPYGGAGGNNKKGSAGTGPGGGGGGGAVKNYESEEDWEVDAYSGAAGYAGLIAYRMWHHEEVA